MQAFIAFNLHFFRDHVDLVPLKFSALDLCGGYVLDPLS